MLADVLACLRCPICVQPLAAAKPRALRCARGHSFDIARQGYVHLGVGRVQHGGDSAQMVAARVAFLSAGHYDFLSAGLAAAAREAYPGGLVVDVGAGPGHHLAAVLDAVPSAAGLALDVSKPALRRAARAHPRAAAALCDAWRPLPIADASAGVLLNVFAPRQGAEFHRVLRPDGVLLVVTPTGEHLGELVDALGLLRVDAEKEARVAATLTDRFAPAGERRAVATLRLDHAAVAALVAMSPSARHTDPDALQTRIAALPEPVTVTAAVRLAAYRPR